MHLVCSFGAATTVYTSVAVFALWLRVLFIGTYVILSIRSLKLGVLANDVWERRAVSNVSTKIKCHLIIHVFCM